MHYEYGGQIQVWDTPKGVDAIREAVDRIVANEEEYGDCTEYIEALSFRGGFHSCMDGYDFGGDYDDMTDMEAFFYWVKDKIIELYPNCSMDAHFNGFNSSSGAESGFTTQLRNGHVKDLDYEFCEEGLPCPDPECGCSFVGFGSVEFDREYDCDECGRHITLDEMNEILSDYVKEYDLELDESNDPEEDTGSVEKIELDLTGKKVVTTGLSAADERWVQEQVESRGGEYKPKFVVSLDYLIYNPDYDHETVKYAKAKEQIEKGKPVKIITFEDFKRSL